jgi:DNA-binding MarR family transcriptional regulator
LPVRCRHVIYTHTGPSFAREVDPDDRRRMILQATERGRTAAAAVLAGVMWVDTELAARLSPPELKGLRAGLVALCDIREGLEEG